MVKSASALFISLFAFLYSYSQNTIVINSNEVNVHIKAMSQSKVISVVNVGDTVFLQKISGSWLDVVLSNGQQGFILKKYTSPVYEITPVSIKQQATIDMTSWNFSLLFSATFKYFLLITLILLFVFLLIHYFK